MKKLNVIKAVVAVTLLSSVFIMYGCKKEQVANPVTTTTTTTTSATVTKNSTTPVAVETQTTVDSSNYLKGYLGDSPVKFEGTVAYYHGYVNPDSTQNQGGNNSDQGGQNEFQQQYNSAYYVNGSKWVSLSSTGLQIINASVELRSLAVRVFVSPIQAQSSTYYNLIALMPYQVATNDNPSNGAYISVTDTHGVLWTSAGDQDGSSVIVTSRGPNMIDYALVTGIISCKMYDGHGHMQKLTGATFTASLGI